MALKPATLQWSDAGTLKSLDFGDVYFQPHVGLAEKDYVFLQGNDLPDRFKRADHFTIAELGFGTGLNFLLTLNLWDKVAPMGAALTYISIEKHPLLKGDLEKFYQNFQDIPVYAPDILTQYPPLITGLHTLHFLAGRVKLILALGDVAEILPELTGKVDAWYLDGFAPAKNAAMWADDVYAHMARLCKHDTSVATFSAAGDVRRGLQSAGFSVTKTKGYGVKRDMTTAIFKGAEQKITAAKKPVVVIGAGIAGASCAYALALRGYQVTVVDQAPEIAAATSGNNIGIVYPKITADASPLGVFHQHAFCYTKNLLANLKLPSWTPVGVTHLVTDDTEKKRQEKLAVQEYPTDYLRVDEGGLHHDSAGYLSPPAFCKRLLDHPNITLRLHTTVRDLAEFKNSIVIVATANDSKNFTETAWLPLQSLRGQISHIKATAQSEKIARVYCYEGYITPALNGIHTIGATFDKEGFSDVCLREGDHLKNIQKLQAAMPDLHLTVDAVVGGRVGYRAATPDRIPLVGPVPNYEITLDLNAGKRGATFQPAGVIYHDDFYVATGFGSHGMTGAPLAGEILAAMITGEPLPIPQSLLAHIIPERFIWRDLKRNKV